MKILICDDDFMMLKAIEHRLLKDGYEIISAADGKIASEKIKSENFDLIITDMLMPYFSGLEIINLVRNELKIDTRIIVLSKLGNDDSIIEAFKLGADDYMTKPFSPNELSIRVKRFSLLKK